MMQLRWMLNGALVTSAFCLILTLTLVVMSELQTVRADLAAQPIAPAVEAVQYARLTDAAPQRDLSAQRFAPLVEVTK